MNGRRVCLLTGASGQLGNTFCQRFANRYDIAAVWLRQPPIFGTADQEVIDPLREQIHSRENAHRIMAIRADVTQPDGITSVVDHVLARFGGVDLLVHAAGYRHWAPILSGSSLLESFEHQFAVNVKAPLALTTEIGRRFWAGRTYENQAANRNVVIITSIAGVQTYLGSGQSVYAASKAAMNHLTRHISAELQGLGVRANGIAPNTFPGIIHTEAVADAIVRLDGASTSGAILVIDQGGEYWI